jgi:hypothetical protein
MTIDPENNPPVPNPARARPTIKATLVGAVAQTRDLQPGCQHLKRSLDGEDLPKLKNSNRNEKRIFDLQ